MSSLLGALLKRHRYQWIISCWQRFKKSEQTLNEARALHKFLRSLSFLSPKTRENMFAQLFLSTLKMLFQFLSRRPTSRTLENVFLFVEALNRISCRHWTWKWLSIRLQLEFESNLKVFENKFFVFLSTDFFRDRRQPEKAIVLSSWVTEKGRRSSVPFIIKLIHATTKVTIKLQDGLPSEGFA